MIIGIDVDGVLVDLAGYQLKSGKAYFEELRNMPATNEYAYDIKDIYSCSMKLRDDFWMKYIWRYCLLEPMTCGASLFSEKMRSFGHKIIIVTGRVHTTETGITGIVFRCMLKFWLKKNGFKYDEICYCSEHGSADEKAKICKQKNIDVLIDDKPSNLYASRDFTKVICYDAPWNKGHTELDFCRVHNFMEIEQSIQIITGDDK